MSRLTLRILVRCISRVPLLSVKSVLRVVIAMVVIRLMSPRTCLRVCLRVILVALRCRLLISRMTCVVLRRIWCRRTRRRLEAVRRSLWIVSAIPWVLVRLVVFPVTFCV